MVTKRRSSSAKENEQVVNPPPDADLVLGKPGPYNKAQFPKPLSEMQITEIQKGPVVPNTDKRYCLGFEDLRRNERNKDWRPMSAGSAGQTRS